jgi:hypothetical protein
MSQTWEIRMQQCQRAGCVDVARWELWTLMTYHYFCDSHRRPESELVGGWEQRWRPEGVLECGADVAIKDTFRFRPRDEHGRWIGE